MPFITTNTELQELATEALENYLFDLDTDPEGKIEAGLKIVLSGDAADSQVADTFQESNFPKGSDKWDALDIYAKALAG